MLTALVIGMLALFTYIPGITAKDQGIHSQVKRFKAAEKRLLALSPGDDSLRLKEGRTMYHSIEYVHEVKRNWVYNQDSNPFAQEKLGYSTPQAMLDSLFSPDMQEKVKASERYCNDDIYYSFDYLDSLNIQDYTVLKQVTSNVNVPLYEEFSCNSGQLRIYQNNDIFLEFNVAEWFNQQLTSLELPE